MAPSEQVDLALASTTIAGSHGAALALMMFASPGGTAIELTEPSRPMDAFARIAASAHLRYLSLDIPDVNRDSLDQLLQTSTRRRP